MKYINLGIVTDYTLLSSLIKIDNLIDYAIKNKIETIMEALSKKQSMPSSFLVSLCTSFCHRILLSCSYLHPGSSRSYNFPVA